MTQSLEITQVLFHFAWSHQAITSCCANLESPTFLHCKISWLNYIYAIQIVHIWRTIIEEERMENGSCVSRGLLLLLIRKKWIENQLFRQNKFQNKPSLKLLLKLDKQKCSCSGKVPPGTEWRCEQLFEWRSHFGIPIF